MRIEEMVQGLNGPLRIFSDRSVIIRNDPFNPCTISGHILRFQVLGLRFYSNFGMRVQQLHFSHE